MGDRLLWLCNGERASSWLMPHSGALSSMQDQFTPHFKSECSMYPNSWKLLICVPNMFTMHTKYDINLDCHFDVIHLV